MTASKFELMRHALGVQEHPRSKQGYLDMLAPRWKLPYRNHFCASGDHVEIWDGLVAIGFATRREGSELTGGDPTFFVTEAGRAAALAGLVIKKKWGYGQPTNP